MMKANSRKRNEALLRLQEIVSESINQTNPQRSRTQLFNWTNKYLSASDWQKTKKVWKKIL